MNWNFSKAPTRSFKAWAPQRRKRVGKTGVAVIEAVVFPAQLRLKCQRHRLGIARDQPVDTLEVLWQRVRHIAQRNEAKRRGGSRAGPAVLEQRYTPPIVLIYVSI